MKKITERQLLWGGLIVGYAKPIFVAVNTVIGLGGIGSDLASWRSTLLTVVGGYTVLDWALLSIGTLCLVLALFPRLRIGRPIHVFDTELTERVSAGDTLEAHIVRTSKLKLTDAERERALDAMSEVMDFYGKDLTPFQAALNRGLAAGPASGVDICETLEPDLERLIQQANVLIQKHNYHLNLARVRFSIILQRLEALRNPMIELAAAKGWPREAMRDRLHVANQKMSDLGGDMGNLYQEIVARRNDSK